MILYILKAETQTSAFTTIDNLFIKARFRLALTELKKVGPPSFLSNYKNYKALYPLAKLSEDNYKDKKIAYKHYLKYIDKFESKDVVITNFVKIRIKEIKKAYFLKGENLE
jgi:hypothetical protein